MKLWSVGVRAEDFGFGGVAAKNAKGTKVRNREM